MVNITDVGWNPIASIFHVWSGSYGETRRTSGRTRGNHGEERGKTLNQQGIGHTSARSKNTKRYTRSKVNKGKDTKVTDLLREEALNPQRDLPTRGS